LSSFVKNKQLFLIHKEKVEQSFLNRRNFVDKDYGSKNAINRA
jgi:hypothetical protein